MRVDGQVVGSIGAGLLVLLGVQPGDRKSEAAWLTAKLAGLRIFPDDAGKMNRSVVDVGGSALVVSQFTLMGDCRKGRRPSFVKAAGPVLAEPLFRHFCEAMQAYVPVERGVFGADMAVSLVNDGPVTLILDRSPE